MLSLSADNAQQDVDLQVINGQGDGGVPHGAELMRFAEAVARGDPDALTVSRNALFEAAGSEVLVDAAAVAGNFQRMVRIADATGIPLDGVTNTLSGGVQEELELRRFPSARNTPALTWLQKGLRGPLRMLARRILRAPRGGQSRP